MSLEDRLTEYLRSETGYLFAIIHRYVDDASACNDVFQESYLIMQTKLHTFKGKSDASFRCWCKTIVRHKAIDQLRRSRAAKRRAISGVPVDGETLDQRVDDNAVMPLDALVTLDERAEVKERYRKVRQWVDEAPMSPAHRNAFEAVHLKGMPHREAAELLGISVGLLRTHLNRALVRIRNYIASQLN